MQQPNFHENERALCFHGPLIYEAIFKVEIRTDAKKHGEIGPHYFVHYKGWKQTWDEWVAESRLLKFNEENLARQKQLFEAQRAKDRAEREALKRGDLDTSLSNKSASASRASGNKDYVTAGVDKGARGTKRSRESVQEEEEFRNKPEIKLVIPDILKVKLVDDWEAITKNAQLIPLPRTPTVSKILDDYAAATASTLKPSQISILKEVIAGLKLYFDKSLGNNLLYRFERGQYSEMKRRFSGLIPDETEEKREMCNVYGVEHLLRLFVNLPELMAHSSMDADTISVLREHLQDILRYIAQEKDTLFNIQYEETSQAYQNISRQ